MTKWKLVFGLLMGASCTICSLLVCFPESYLYNHQISFDGNLTDFVGLQNPNVEAIVEAAKRHSEQSSLLWTDAQVRFVSANYRCSGTDCTLRQLFVNVDIRFRFKTPFFYGYNIIGRDTSRLEEKTFFSSYAVESTQYTIFIDSGEVRARTPRAEQYDEDHYLESPWGKQAVDLDEAIAIGFSHGGDKYAEEGGTFTMRLHWEENWLISFSSGADIRRLEIDDDDGSVTILEY